MWRLKLKKDQLYKNATYIHMSNVHIPKYDDEDTLTLKIGYSSKMKTYKKEGIYELSHIWTMPMHQTQEKYYKIRKSEKELK